MTLVTEEPYAFIAHVRVCGGAGWATACSTRKPTPTASARATLRLLARLTAGVRLRVVGAGWQASVWGRQSPATAGVREVPRPPSGVSMVWCRYEAPWQGGRGARRPCTCQRRGPSVPRGGDTRWCRAPCVTGGRSTWRQAWSTARWHRRASPPGSVAGVPHGGDRGVCIPPSHRRGPAREGSPRQSVPPLSRCAPWLGGPVVVAQACPSRRGPGCGRQPVRRASRPPARCWRLSRAAGVHTAWHVGPDSLRVATGGGRAARLVCCSHAPVGQWSSALPGVTLRASRAYAGVGVCGVPRECPAGGGAAGPAGTGRAGSPGHSGAEQGLAGDWK